MTPTPNSNLQAMVFAANNCSLDMSRALRYNDVLRFLCHGGIEPKVLYSVLEDRVI